MDQAQEGQILPECCQGKFSPNDLFAKKSLASDLEQSRSGDLAATLRVGFAHYTGMSGITDIQRARAYFLVASRNSIAGSAWLGYVDAAAHIKPGAAARKSASFQGLVKAAAAGDPVGQTLLGRVYERGFAGYKPRPDKAQKLYEAAAAHFALAKTGLGRLLLKQPDGYQKALSLFRDAAAAGETTGMIALAKVYSTMKPPRVTGMRRLLRTAGEKGDRLALYLLAREYQQERPGSGANPQGALKLLHDSAVRGYKPALKALVAAYAKGEGGASSAELARFWMRKSSLPSLKKQRPPVAAGKQRPVTAG